ncbi:PREDICTED: uncharacterized protein LOC108363441 [Rhagoletis zephyria]|uniref:uncharacterized protein LOC108363441 n=1 Tax=Rhagoletis zephyria TaxID=28612 RepID=UPI000811551F|nr:PREDICTED: uncharacterized protein LOC108363441 [Rhagoletis zephyria]
MVQCATTHQDSILNDSIKAFWQLENINYPLLNLTKDERQSEIHFTENFTRLPCGRYQVRLPFKMSPSALGQSYDLALRRFRSLELRFRKDTTLHLQYKEFVNEFIFLSYMEPISDVDLSVPHYFIPHHHVLKPSSSTTKLRVVFDASSKTSSGVSLNELLLVGPAIQTDLLSTVLRFRYYTYVFTADFSKMYRQVSLHPNDRRFHYIPWRSDERDPIAIY